jgi:ABC-type Zn uptake system ZnuABC Zn-binding protein ZnuA
MLFKRIKKTDVAVFLIVFAIIGLIFYVGQRPSSENKQYSIIDYSKLPKVYLATSFPLAVDWIKAAGQDRVDIRVFTSPTDPKLETWLLDASENDQGFDYRLFFSVGEGFDDWTKSLESRSSRVKVMSLDQFISVSQKSYPDILNSKNNLKTVQLYYWLSLENVREAVQGIAKSLSQLDVGNKEHYINNAYEYSIQLDTLLRESLDVLKGFKGESVALDTAKWFSLVDSLQLHVVGAFDISSGQYDVDKAGTTLRSYLKKAGAKTIITGNSTDPQSAAVLLQDSSFKVVRLDPWGINSVSYVSYIRNAISEIMRSL